MPRTGELYIFGDSLSDDGATGVQAVQEPVDLFFAGRASNGPVWHEYIRDNLAVAPRATEISQAPGLDGFLGGSDLNGINFAHGGAVSSSTGDPDLPGAVQQAEGFASLVASGDIPAPDDQDVFAIWIGGNDFLQFADASIGDILRILNLGPSIIDNIDTAVDTLTAVGAQNFLILGQPTIGGAFLGQEAPSGSFAARIWNGLADRYNDALEDFVEDLDAVEGLSALFVDIAGLIDDIEDDPTGFGFSNVSSDIVSDGAALDDQSYFSVDGIHPTGAGHAVIADFVVTTAAAAEFDLTALAGNVLPGSARNDALVGTAGDDTATGAAGDDRIDGGKGTDIAVFSGAETHYTLVLGQDVLLTDRRGNDGTDTLVDIETLAFQGTELDLTLFDDATALVAGDFRKTAEIYLSYFNRAPDALGLTFWADALANGLGFDQIAEAFATSEEGVTAFPLDLPEAEFVTAIYANTLGRAPDGEGFDFWLGALSAGAVTRSQMVLEVLEGARATLPTEAPAELVDQQAADQSYLDGKVDVGVYFSAILGMSNAVDAASVMALYDGSTESISAARLAADAAFDAASAADGSGAFLVQLTGLVDNPFLL